MNTDVSTDCESEKVVRLSDEDQMALNLRQVGIGLDSVSDRFACANRENGSHEVMGGALGNLVAVPRGFICPACDYTISASDIPAQSISAAHESVAIKSPSAQSKADAEARMAEYHRYADIPGRELAYIMCRSFKRYVDFATKELQKPKWKGPTLDGIPVTLLLSLHNNAEPGSTSRKDVLTWLEVERALRPRQHWMDAIEITETGDLIFNDDLYTLACWRGKQETYFESAAKGFEALQKGLQFVSHFQKSEDKSAAGLPAATRLFSQRELLPEVQSLKAFAPQLAQFVQALDKKSLSEITRTLQLPAPQPDQIAQGPTED